jgi:hypothetical protein
LLDAIEVEVVLGTNPDGSPTINQAPRSKLRGMNCAFPGSRFSTGLRHKRRGIRSEEIEWQVMPRVYQRAGKIARQTDEEKSV